MRPSRREPEGFGDLFRARLDQIIDMKHELDERSGLSYWRKRIGDKLKVLRAESLPVANDVYEFRCKVSVTTRPSRSGCSCPARSVASADRSNASCGDARPSRPLSGT